MLVNILEKIPLLIAGGLLAAAVLIICIRSKNVNRSEFLQIFKTLDYFPLWVLICCVLLTGTWGVLHHFRLKQSVHAIISLNYSEASQALNSNGTRYNMSEIISDEVVEAAIRKGALPDVTVEELKDCLVVYPCVQGGVGDESEYHISTEFAVEYHASKHTEHLDAGNVILLITTAYKDYYIGKYTDNFSLDSSKNPPDFSQMEYMDIVSYLDKEATSVLNFLYGAAAKSPSFVNKNGSTFNSIAGRVYQFKQIQIEQKLKSLVLQNGIVRNESDYVDRLTYQNTNTGFDCQKNEISLALCQRAIDRYAEEMTRVVLVPTWDQSGQYYMGRTKVGIDELSIMGTQFSDTVASQKKDIAYNNLLIEKMDQNNSSDESADALIESIYNTILDFEKEAINAEREYSSQRMNQCIAVSLYGVSLMHELKGLLLFAAFSYVSLILFYKSGKFPKKA